jgi:hypothetical protein
MSAIATPVATVTVQIKPTQQSDELDHYRLMDHFKIHDDEDYEDDTDMNDDFIMELTNYFDTTYDSDYDTPFNDMNNHFMNYTESDSIGDNMEDDETNELKMRDFFNISDDSDIEI